MAHAHPEKAKVFLAHIAVVTLQTRDSAVEPIELSRCLPGEVSPGPQEHFSPGRLTLGFRFVSAPALAESVEIVQMHITIILWSAREANKARHNVTRGTEKRRGFRHEVL